MANEQAQTSEREIEEDVVNVGFIAWLGGVATILIAVSVILLTAVYYVTLDQREARLQEEADAQAAEAERLAGLREGFEEAQNAVARINEEQAAAEAAAERAEKRALAGAEGGEEVDKAAAEAAAKLKEEAEKRIAKAAQAAKDAI